MNKRFSEASVSNVTDPAEFNILRSALPTIAGSALTADKAYWVYVGRVKRGTTLNKVLCHVTTGGTGAQTAEIALATSDNAPNRASQVLTVVAVDGSLGDLTGTGVLGSGSALGYAAQQTVHLWAGIRTNMASTQPAVYGHTFDASNGEVLVTATAGVLAVGSTYTGALVTAAVTWQAPALFVSAA